MVVYVIDTLGFIQVSFWWFLGRANDGMKWIFMDWSVWVLYTGQGDKLVNKKVSRKDRKL